MDLTAILIGMAIALLAGTFIVRPLADQRHERLEIADHRLSSLQADQDRILTLIEELDLDHAVGKVLDKDYHVERSRLMRQGAENLKVMDELMRDSPLADEPGGRERSLEDELEASVAKYRRSMSHTGHDFCGNCGEQILIGDRFCVACGTKLSTLEDQD